jgi:hypothetical protein
MTETTLDKHPETRLAPFAQSVPASTVAVATVAKPDEKMVQMRFPRKVLLNVNNHQMIAFGAGIQNVPESLSKHPHLLNSGVRPVRTVEPLPSEEQLEEAKRVARVQKENDEALAAARKEEELAAQALGLNLGGGSSQNRQHEQEEPSELQEQAPVAASKPVQMPVSKAPMSIQHGRPGSHGGKQKNKKHR